MISNSRFSSIFPNPILIFFFVISPDLNSGPKYFPNKDPRLDELVRPIILNIQNNKTYIKVVYVLGCNPYKKINLSTNSTNTPKNIHTGKCI